jgi:hypothetical protein
LDNLPDDFKVTLVLADNAEVAEGKLFILGAGWFQTIPGSPGSLAGIISVPWTETNRKHIFVAVLVEADGSPVTIETPAGNQEVQLRAEFEIGRPPGLPPGMQLNQPFAANYASLPVQSGKMYEWRYSINGKSRSDWRLPFYVR